MNNNGWIDVKDDRIKDYANKEILIYADFGVKIAIYTVDDSPCFDDDGVEYDFSHCFSDEHGDFAWELDDVWCWQPLPQPPKE